MLSETFFSKPEEAIRQQFLAERAEDFKKFSADLKTRDEVQQRFRFFQDNIGTRENDLFGLEQRLAQYSAFAVEDTIFKNLGNYGLHKLDFIANEISFAVVLKTYLPGVVKIAREDLASWKQSFEDFKNSTLER